MRITKPREWEFMTDEQKQKWAIESGKRIEEAKKKFIEFMRGGE